MQIQSINQYNSQTFKARIRLKNIGEISGKLSDIANPTVASIASSGGIASTSSTASHVIGAGSNVLSTASALKFSGVDSFGIVPSAIGYAGAHGATPATVASANANPSIMSSIMSSIGNFIESLGHIKIDTKDPS